MKKKSIVILIFLLVTHYTFASNFTFLTDSPVSYFTKDDWNIYTAAQDKAVRAKDGVKINWKNSETGAWGYFLPSNTHKENGMVCRDLKIVNNAKQRSGEANYKICKTPNGWKAY